MALTLLSNILNSFYFKDLDKDQFFNYEWPGIAECLLGMFIAGIVGWIVLLFIEFSCWKRIARFLKYRSDVSLSIDTIDMDSDVVYEKAKVNQMDASDFEKYNLVVKNLSKKYGRVFALKDMSIAVGG